MWSDPPENDHFSGPQPTCYIQLSWKFTQMYIHQNLRGTFLCKPKKIVHKNFRGQNFQKFWKFSWFWVKKSPFGPEHPEGGFKGFSEKSHRGFVWVENTIWVLVFSISAQNGWIRFCTWSPWHTFNQQIWPSAKFKLFNPNFVKLFPHWS